MSGTLFDFAAYLYTESVKRSCRAAEAPKFGVIGFNTGAISTEVAPSPESSNLVWARRHSGIEEYPEMKSFLIDGRA